MDPYSIKYDSTWPKKNLRDFKNGIDWYITKRKREEREGVIKISIFHHSSAPKSYIYKDSYQNQIP